MKPAWRNGCVVVVALTALAAACLLPSVITLARTSRQKNRMHLLYKAAQGGDTVTIKRLLAEGELFRSEDAALAGAAQRGQVEALRLLLPHTTGRGRCNALWFAARDGQTEAVRMLLPYRDEQTGALAVSSAAEEGHLETLRVLLPHTSSNAKNDALRVAVAENEPQTVALLLSHGADPKGSLHDGTPFLRYAQEHDNHEVVGLLKAALAKAPRTPLPRHTR